MSKIMLEKKSLPDEARRLRRGRFLDRFIHLKQDAAWNAAAFLP